MPELEKIPPPSTIVPLSRPAVGSILTGAFVAILGFVAATTQGMTTAPSHAAADVAMIVMALGCALALFGLASVWLPRFSKAGADRQLGGAGPDRAGFYRRQGDDRIGVTSG